MLVRSIVTISLIYSHQRRAVACPSQTQFSSPLVYIHISSFPHGRVSLWALLFACIAYSLAISASFGCFFVTVQIPYDRTFGGTTFEGSMGFGLMTHSRGVEHFYGAANHVCIPWSYNAANYFFDEAWQTARAFGIIANICTGISMLAAFIMTCMPFSETLIRVFTGLLFFGSLCELLTFVAFASSVCSDYDCQFGESAGFAIGGSIAAFIAGILFCKIPLAPDDDFIPAVIMDGGEAPGTVMVQETVEPDGTKKIVKITVNADGSKTVEETIERPAAKAY